MADIQEIPHPPWSSYGEGHYPPGNFPHVFFRWHMDVFCREEMTVRGEEKFFRISHSWGREENKL